MAFWIMNGSYTDTKLKEWVSQQNVKVLTLDGTYGGRNGKEFDFLSSDLKAQDDWHIGKRYNEQSNPRYAMVLYRDIDGCVKIRKQKDGELHNCYLVCSKRDMRMNNLGLRHALTSKILNVADGMVSRFVEKFNKGEF